MWNARVYQILQAHNLILHNKGGQYWRDSREPAIWCRISRMHFLALKKCHTCSAVQKMPWHVNACHIKIVKGCCTLAPWGCALWPNQHVPAQASGETPELQQLLEPNNGSKCAHLWRCEKMLPRGMLKEKQSSTRAIISVKGFRWSMSAALTVGVGKTTAWIFD